MANIDSKIANEKSCWNTIGVWGSSENRCEKLDEKIHCRNCEVFSQAGRSVFDRQAPDGYIAQWSKEINLPQSVKDKKKAGVLIFRVESEWFALAAGILQEITENKIIHTIPNNSKPVISGIVNIGGEVKLCFSLVELLGVKKVNKKYSENTSRIYNRLIVIVIDGDHYVFQVDEVTGIYRYSSDEILPIPNTLENVKAELLTGLFIYNDKQIAMLHTDNIHASLKMALL